MTTYTVYEMMGNYSEIVATFDNETEATDYISDVCTERTNEVYNYNLDDTDFNYENEYQNQASYFNIELIETDLYTTIVDGDDIKTYGEDIIDSFYDGNFYYGVEQLKEINVTAIEFGDYVQELCEDMGHENMSKFAQGHFDYNFFICLGREAL